MKAHDFLLILERLCKCIKSVFQLGLYCLHRGTRFCSYSKPANVKMTARKRKVIGPSPEHWHFPTSLKQLSFKWMYTFSIIEYLVGHNSHSERSFNVILSSRVNVRGKVELKKLVTAVLLDSWKFFICAPMNFQSEKLESQKFEDWYICMVIKSFRTERSLRVMIHSVICPTDWISTQ